MLRWFRKLSLKRKQMVIIMLTSTAALLLATVVFATFEILTSRKSAVHKLATLAEVTGSALTPHLRYNVDAEAREKLSIVNSETGIVAAWAFSVDEEGTEKLFTSYHRSGTPSPFVRPTEMKRGHEFRSDHVLVWTPVRGDENGIDRVIGWIFLKSDLKTMYARVANFLGISFAVLVAASLFSFLLSTRLQTLVSTPILRLAETARTIADKKNYALRVEKHSPDEIGQLIDNFNEMLSQIQTRDAALQQAQVDLEERVVSRTHELELEIHERKRAEGLLQQQLTRINLLNQITRAIADRKDLQSIFLVVLRYLEEQLPIHFSGVYMLNAQGDQMTVVAHGPKSKSAATDLGLLVGTTVPVSATVFASGLPSTLLYHPQPVSESSIPSHKLSPDAMQSVIFVPLMVEAKPFALLVAGRTHGHAFSSGACEFLKTLGEHVALAAHQTRLRTELESAYVELRETQEAALQQERLQALGQMASGIAHDINNALSPVVGFADLLLYTEPNLSTEAVKYLNQIKTAGQDIAHTVDRLKEFYRRRQETEPLFSLHLNQLVHQTVDLTRPRWRDMPQEQGIIVEMRTDLHAELPSILGSESEVRQALTNLILNAVDAMPKGGSLTLRTNTRTVEGSEEVVLEVVDSGTGMTDEIRLRCLEPFFSTKGQRGTGLGLAMVYGVMDRHHGRIEIDSAVGVGTTFRLIFPAHLAAAPSIEIQPNKLNVPPLRILCVDDEPMVLEVMRKILERDNHLVVCATGGQAGIDAFAEAQGTDDAYEVVITDLGMPGIDGRQVAQAVKQRSSETPIIMLTGWGTFLKVEGDQPLNVDEILSKPPTVKDLQQGLLAVTRKYRMFETISV